MYQRWGKRTGLALIALALCLRLLSGAMVKNLREKVVEAMKSPGFFRLVLALSTWEEPPEAEDTSLSAGDRLWVLHQLNASGEETPTPAIPLPTPLTAAEGNAIKIAGACTYTVDKSALMLKATPLTKAEGPTVLIVHTHTSEAYTQTTGFFYEEREPLRTGDTAQSVVRVGEEIATALQERGISVLHDQSCNDYPDYNGSYTRTGKKIAQWLKEYPSIQVVLDVHRDALENADGSIRRLVHTLSDGTAVAPLMLVVGTNQGGTNHPGWQDNLSWALKLQALLEREEPGLCRNLDLRTERFNQHYTPKSLIVEVGSTGNILPEALRSARLLGESLADLIEMSYI